MESCEFDWKLVQSENGKEIMIAFDFKQKAAMSLGEESDYVTIIFWGAPLIMSE